MKEWRNDFLLKGIFFKGIYFLSLSNLKKLNIFGNKAIFVQSIPHLFYVPNNGIDIVQLHIQSYNVNRKKINLKQLGTVIISLYFK